jgi:hypothetical protein
MPGKAGRARLGGGFAVTIEVCPHVGGIKAKMRPDPDRLELARTDESVDRLARAGEHLAEVADRQEGF